MATMPHTPVSNVALQEPRAWPFRTSPIAPGLVAIAQISSRSSSCLSSAASNRNAITFSRSTTTAPTAEPFGFLR